MKTTIQTFKLLGLALLAALVLGLQAAQAITITSAFTGSWYDPATPGQGFNLEVIDGQQGKQMLAYWYSFDLNGNWFWAFGVGDVEANQAMVPMQRIVGGLLTKGTGQLEPWATVTITFNDCDSGEAEAEFDEQVGSGFQEQVGSGGPMQLERITRIAGDDCSGGISDDTDPDEPPEVFEVLFENTGLAPDAVGVASFESRPDRSEFDVVAEGLPLGLYELLMNLEPVGEFEVVESELGGTRGAIYFRSPAEPDERLLDFDPRGKRFDIVGDGQVYLTTETPAEGEDPSGDDDINPPPFGDAITEIGLENTGVFPDGSGWAWLEQRAESVEFVVGVDNLPIDVYDVSVGGEIVGELEVSDVTKGVLVTRGKIQFRFPVESGKELLYFNPFGQIIAVGNGETVALIGEFPTGPTDECPFKIDCEEPDPEPEPEPEKIVIEKQFTTNCEATSGFGVAKMIIEGDFRYFEIRTEDIPAGEYKVRVGELVRGVLESKGEEFTEGFIAWSDPLGEADLFLDFDPRGKIVKVEQGEVVFLEMEFPTEPIAGKSMKQECPPPDEKIVIEDTFETNCEATSTGVGAAKMIIDGEFRYFEVRTEDLPVGFYDVRVGELIRGSFESKGEEFTQGSMAWSDPVGEAENLLDFDPRGKIVKVEQEGVAFLEMLFPTEPLPAGAMKEGGPCPVDEIVIDAAFDATEIAPEGKGVAIYWENPDLRKFVIEVSDIPEGEYEVWVGETAKGVVDPVKGVINVKLDGEITAGRIEWRDPVEGDGLLLDFDPRGKTIAINRADETYLIIIVFPFE